MKIRQEKTEQAITYLLSFCIPGMVLLFCFYCNDVFPFGENTIYATDLAGQYSAFLSYLQGILHGENDIFYTFSKTLGGDFLGLAAYYLCSPFNLLLAAGSRENLPVIVEVIVVLKICFCGLTMNYYLQKKRRSFFTAFFAVSYALMGYNMAYLYHLMWLDGVILFPLVIWGLEQLAASEGKKKGLYICALGATLLFNYYIGFMVCVAAVFFFFTQLWFKRMESNFVKSSVQFFGASLLAGSLAAFLLLPTAFSLMGGKAGMMLQFTGERVWRLPELCRAFLPYPCRNEPGGIWGQWAPLIYCGSLMLLFVSGYFLSKRKGREKVYYALLLLLLFGISTFMDGDTFWHALNRPVGFPYRYSFILTFLLITIGYLGFTAFACVESKKRVREWIGTVLVLCLLAELSWNASACMKDARERGFLTLENYRQKVLMLEQSIEQIPADGAYRCEKNYQVSLNDPMLMGYSGVSHFSSTEKRSTVAFMENMGYTTYLAEGVNWAGYTGGSTIAADSLFGIRYLLAEENPGSLWEKKADRLYENPYVLPLAVVLEDVDKNLDENADPFLLQSQICGAKIFRQIEPVMTEAGMESGFYQVTYELMPVSHQAAPIYFYMTGEADSTGVTICVDDGPERSYLTTYENGTICLGEFTNEKIYVKIKGETAQKVKEVPQIVQLDVEAFEKSMGQLKSNPVRIEKRSSSFLEGNVTIADKEQDQILLFSIPYDKGWKVWVDGQPADTEVFLDTLMGLRITPGEHTFQLRFRPAGWYAGCSISGLALLYIFIRAGKKKRDLSRKGQA